MKKVLLLGIFACLLSSTTTSCSCDDDGEGGKTFLLTERGKSFLPYQINDTVRLANPILNDTLILTVNQIEDNLGTDEDSSPSPMVGFPECSGGSRPNTIEERFVNFQSSTGCSITNILGPTDNVRIQTLAFGCPLNFEASYFPEALDSITFNNVQYTDVIKVVGNSLENEIFYAKNVGLIAILRGNTAYYLIP
ncbi:hypothetical protein [Nonlabens ulvanivorans]|uniref:Uncharacterized protein n=1 Tax=Nonlabens ulvanivorans TaxID=906888 RepID=A0A084JY05_NONUL|nr:hypothetical protein [Nonlabens ulvanivorans]KEZ93839.1 hypothetical protein IL45_06485 [Nonlabens ulvanivorans]PRX14446.1 hypothetical protein LY02_01476 [Nonlabens ulvanivorans]